VSFSTTSALVAWASGAPRRAGGSSLPFGSHLSRAIYHLELPAGPAGVHEVEHNLAPLRALGIDAPSEPPRLVPRRAAVARAQAFLDGAAPGTGPLVVAHVGAGKLPNIWPAERFAALLAALRREQGVRVVLVEGPSDAEAVAAVEARLGPAPRWRGSLADTLGLLRLAALAVANDTGLSHVAAAAGTATVVVFGPTDPARWCPPGEHVRAVVSATGRIGDVTVEEVLDAARRALGAASRPAQTLRVDT
jgi:ADP-heptose:LPS heptosyltransferase